METENTILSQIQQNIEALQRQLDSMKPPSEPSAALFPEGGLGIKLKEKSEELLELMRETIGENSASAICMAAVFFAENPSHGDVAEADFYFAESTEKIEALDEKKLAAVLEAFSSPRRLKIIKLLMANDRLSSNELTMKTGCIGGQLYHHISILEAAGILCKIDELYALSSYGRSMAAKIFCVASGEAIFASAKT